MMTSCFSHLSGISWDCIKRTVGLRHSAHSNSRLFSDWKSMYTHRLRGPFSLPFPFHGRNLLFLWFSIQAGNIPNSEVGEKGRSTNLKLQSQAQQYQQKRYPSIKLFIKVKGLKQQDESGGNSLFSSLNTSREADTETFEIFHIPFKDSKLRFSMCLTDAILSF